MPLCSYKTVRCSRKNASPPSGWCLAPSLFLAGYIAADRRRLLIPERFTFAFGLAAGAATMILRWYGNGQQAAWQALLAAGRIEAVGADRRPVGAVALAGLLWLYFF